MLTNLMTHRIFLYQHEPLNKSHPGDMDAWQARSNLENFTNEVYVGRESLTKRPDTPTSVFQPLPDTDTEVLE